MEPIARFMMGGCASKPNVLKAEKAPPPVEAQSPAAENVEAETETEAAPQDKTDGVETKNDEPHVDLSEPAAVAPILDETKEADKEEVVPAESETTEPIGRAVEEIGEEKKEVA